MLTHPILPRWHEPCAQLAQTAYASILPSKRPRSCRIRCHVRRSDGRASVIGCNAVASLGFWGRPSRAHPCVRPPAAPPSVLRGAKVLCRWYGHGSVHARAESAPGRAGVSAPVSRYTTGDAGRTCDISPKSRPVSLATSTASRRGTSAISKQSPRPCLSSTPAHRLGGRRRSKNRHAK